MKYLLDTHILLWWLSNDKKLSKELRDTITDADNVIYVSSASVWEMSIKSHLGKLSMPDNLDEMLVEKGFLSLSITLEHAVLAGHLPAIHRDPFDRMLLAQAKIEKLTLLTHDNLLKKYKIMTIVN